MTPKTFESEVLERLARIEEHQQNRAEVCNLHKEDLTALKHEIEGNGKPGIKKEIQKLREEFREFRTQILAYGACAMAVAGFIAPYLAKKFGW